MTDLKITTKQDTDCELDLKEEFGITISPIKADFDAKSEKLIPIMKDEAAKISVCLGHMPEFISDKFTFDAQSRPLYTITVNGRDVHPDQLIQKKNGGKISNLKTDGKGLGKQADINSFDNAISQKALLAKSVFSVASIATSTYFLKNIDEKLEEVEKSIQKVLQQIKTDKESKIKGYLDNLQQIIDDVETAKNNPEYRALQVQKLAHIQTEITGYIYFYEKEIRQLNKEYNDNRTSGREAKNIQDELANSFSFYRTCLQIYALSKVFEIVLVNNYEKESIEKIKRDILSKNVTYRGICDETVAGIYHRNYSKKSTKAITGASKTVKKIGHMMEGTPLEKAGMHRPLSSIGSAGENSAQKKSKQEISHIVVQDDYNLMEKYVESVRRLESIYSNPIQVICAGEDMYLKVSE